MRYKKEGSIMIEVLVSAMIILTLINIVVTSITAKNNSYLLRKGKDNLNRTLYSISKEIQHNHTFSEVESEIKKGIVGFKYYNNFLKDLTTKNLLAMERGEDIILEKISEFNNGNTIEFILKGNFLVEGKSYNMERRFTKSKWMDE